MVVFDRHSCLLLFINTLYFVLQRISLRQQLSCQLGVAGWRGGGEGGGGEGHVTNNVGVVLHVEHSNEQMQYLR